MNQWIDDCINSYYTWLKQNTTHKLDGVTGWEMITTPFVGMFNDMIEVYAKKEGESILLSDDGETLKKLELYGLDANRIKNGDLLRSILLNYGIQLVRQKELTTIATSANFAQKKHNLVSAMLEIGDLIHTSKVGSISSVFKDEVRTYLDAQKIVYTPQFIAKGKTGLDFTFDFQIAQAKSETVMKSFNTLNRYSLSNFLFSWEDVRDIRQEMTGKQLKGLAIVNDVEAMAKTELVNALQSHEADVVMWSERDNIIKKIA